MRLLLVEDDPALRSLYRAIWTESVWSIADAFAGPGAHNRRVRAVRAKAGFGFGVQPYLAPAASGSMVGGLTVRF